MRPRLYLIKAVFLTFFFIARMLFLLILPEPYRDTSLCLVDDLVGVAMRTYLASHA